MNSDYRFEVFSGSEKLGEVRISKGTIDWRPRNARHVMKLTWERFDALDAGQRLRAGRRAPSSHSLIDDASLIRSAY